jgi:hypothetical protein
MKKYTLLNFIVDGTLVFLTGGIWIVWIVIRESQKNR